MSTLLQIEPIVVALRKHKVATVLLILQIALTLAILSNLVFVVHGLVQRSATPIGVDENHIGVIVSVNAVGVPNRGNVLGNLALLRMVPGVTGAAFTAGAPLYHLERDPVFLDPSRQQPIAQMYEVQGSQGLSGALGLRVTEGRGFSGDEIPDVATGSGGSPVPVLMTRALAERLFPGASPLGKLIYDGNASERVIGVVDHLRGEITGRADDDYSIVIEYRFGTQNTGGGYMIRSDADSLQAALNAASKALQQANPGHVQTKRFSLADLRKDYFRGDRAVGRMLVTIMLILLIVTALGVAGLASFWVQQRRRQIGVRRALGATRGDILRYFQIENFVIVTTGTLIGVMVAYALNDFLMSHFELERLPVGYLALGIAVLWGLGQLAVLGPAIRAAAVPPIVASRHI